MLLLELEEGLGVEQVHHNYKDMPLQLGVDDTIWHRDTGHHFVHTALVQWQHLPRLVS